VTLALRRRWNLETGTSLAVYATLAEAALLLLAFRTIVFTSLRSISPWAFRQRRPHDPSPPPDLEMRIGRAVQAAVRLLRWKDCCLPAALAVKAMLARRGFPSSIHLGVGKDAGAMIAHAWIEAGGQVITGESQLHRVTPIVRGGPD
jgi:hypothetical protein